MLFSEAIRLKTWMNGERSALAHVNWSTNSQHFQHLEAAISGMVRPTPHCAFLYWFDQITCVANVSPQGGGGGGGMGVHQAWIMLLHKPPCAITDLSASISYNNTLL